MIDIQNSELLPYDGNVPNPTMAELADAADSKSLLPLCKNPISTVIS